MLRLVAEFVRSLENLADILNHYANLLLVVVTTAYVVLTWKSVRALRDASLRDIQARHLQRIKEEVVQPLITWLDEVERALKGGIPSLIGMGETASLKNEVHIGEDQFNRKREILTYVPKPYRLSDPLYLDSKSTHFAKEMASYEALRKGLAELSKDCAAFARTCSDDMPGTLKRGYISGDSTGIADADLLAVECIRALMGGLKIPFIDVALSSARDLTLEAYTQGRQGRLAVGDPNLVDSWLRSGVQLVGSRWENNPIVQRIAELITQVEGLRKALDTIRSADALDDYCAFVGGARPRRWLRFRRRRSNNEITTFPSA